MMMVVYTINIFEYYIVSVKTLPLILTNLYFYTGVRTTKVGATLYPVNVDLLVHKEYIIP